MTDISLTANVATMATDFPTRKAVIVALLLFSTLIAGWLISGVVEEREARQIETLHAFQGSWGPEQVLSGPVLVIPYQSAPNKARTYLEIAPENLKAKTVLSPQERRRKLFHVTVYSTVTELQGNFKIPHPESLGVGAKLFWEDAFVIVNTSTLSGMTTVDHFTWKGVSVPWQNCRELISREDCVVSSALVAHVPFSTPPDIGTSLPFAASLSLRGTSSFNQAFQRANLDATVEAPWPTPSFGGSLLPVDSSISGTGFQAHWTSADYTSPRVWSSDFATEKDAQVGNIASIALLEATPTYRMINRASKYNILFVILSFTTYFLFELLTKLRIHPLQYGLLGASLTLFALLLVSFAEMIGYDAGYAISAGLVLLQASAYTATVTRRVLSSLLFGVMLASLFGFLYVLLSLETYSLLVGSLGLFLVISLVMLLTQRSKWFAVAQTEEA
jgi:inner membrane protein